MPVCKLWFINFVAYNFHFSMAAKRLFAVFIVLLLSACSKTDRVQEKAAEGTYFSIIEFAQDQWYMYQGQPRSILKKVYFDGKTDSTYTNAFEVDWASVLKVFFETDISDPKYIGQYDFSAFEEATTTSKGFYYEAKNEKLYTRRIHITSDYFTDNVKSIYIEAEKSDRMGTKSLKLFYEPLQSISIHELETSKTGQKKELRVVYEYM
jgi:uncharacterized lipoprotein